jgi:hypothetical protein
MEELTTTTLTKLLAAMGFSLFSVFTGLDGSALIGAFAGAALFVITSRDVGPWYRLAYLLISLVMGYLLAPEIIAHSFVEQTAVAAFIGGVLCVTIALVAIEKIKQIDIVALLAALFRR